ncbi:SLAM family member 9-like [Neoarius graeffei]|uniref:SLAM family member 9-like n=1 Tax=Neoarius graeffei TaxID=443677 RepID=UPI00298D4DD2|nr:SLAM family member 9-like [Neoarius graeffei]
MVAAMQLLLFFLFIFIPITVSDGIFKLVNSSVQLDVQKKDYEFDDFTWTFNKSKSVVKYYKNYPSKVYPEYKNRVEVNEQTQSLTLKNLQKTDSGLYEAAASGEQNQIVAEYQLTVLDPVEKPVLNGPYPQSNETCNVTLSCEAQKLSVTAHCYSDRCDMKENEKAVDGFLSLSLYVSNSFIICNHSNPVSWKNTTMEMKYVKQVCPSNGDTMNPSKSNMTVIIVSLLFAILIIILIIIIIYIFIRHKKLRTPDSGNTVYEEVKADKKPVEMSENPEHPSTVYCTVTKPTQTCNNDESTVSTADPSDKEMDPSDKNLYDTPDQNQQNGSINDVPQTIYAVVNKAGKQV